MKEKFLVVSFYWGAMYVILIPWAYIYDLWVELVPVAIFYGGFIAQMINALWKRRNLELLQQAERDAVNGVSKRITDLRLSQLYNRSFFIRFR